jgi:hypothetical protein
MTAALKLPPAIHNIPPMPAFRWEGTVLAQGGPPGCLDVRCSIGCLRRIVTARMQLAVGRGGWLRPGARVVVESLRHDLNHGVIVTVISNREQE